MLLIIVIKCRHDGMTKQSFICCQKTPAAISHPAGYNSPH